MEKEMRQQFEDYIYGGRTFHLQRDGDGYKNMAAHIKWIRWQEAWLRGAASQRAINELSARPVQTFKADPTSIIGRIKLHREEFDSTLIEAKNAVEAGWKPTTR